MQQCDRCWLEYCASLSDSEHGEWSQDIPEDREDKSMEDNSGEEIHKSSTNLKTLSFDIECSKHFSPPRQTDENEPVISISSVVKPGENKNIVFTWEQ
jgi:DNA polymerase elongation subunit (family B)